MLPSKPKLISQEIISFENLNNLTGFQADLYRNKKYAVVNYDAIPDLYFDFWKLFSDHIKGWDEKFNCIHFTSLYIELAQLKFASKSVSYYSKADALAMGEFWYHPDGFKNGVDHSIVIIYTTKGIVFIEPQSGKEVNLTKTELMSVKRLVW
jgi:hypothetical protein